MPSSTLMTPRPVPRKLAPALAALLVLGVALAVFLVAGWYVRGWALGAADDSGRRWMNGTALASRSRESDIKRPRGDVVGAGCQKTLLHMRGRKTPA